MMTILRSIGLVLLTFTVLRAGEAAPDMVAGVEAAPAEPTPEQLVATDGSKILGIYDEAVARLEKICDDYRRIKAIELSQARDIAFADAYDNVSSVMPELQQLDRDLLRRDITNPKDIQPHKREVARIESEVEMMVELAAKLLEEIEKVQMRIVQQAPQPQQEKTLEEIVQQEQFDPTVVEQIAEQRPEQQQEQMKELEEQAKETPQEQAKDLTPLMHQMVQIRPDIEDLTQEQQSNEELTMQLFTSTNEGIEGLMGRVDLDSINKTMGRRVVEAEGGEPVEWMFIDTWYTIGPFPNPSRANIHRQFPPETVIDLGATYVGKNNRTISWEFLQSGEVQCVPNNDEEYAIYYAYTEVYMDRPMDLWIAIGSDDKANVWLNDLPVWISSDQLKGWKVNEGFRKVTFQQGVNRILYRVENGWMGTAFSLGIRVAP